MSKPNISEIWLECKTLINQAVKDIQEQLKSKSDAEIRETSDSYTSKITPLFNEIIKFIRQHLVVGYDKFYGVMLLDIKTVISYRTNAAIDTSFKETQIKITLNPLFMGNMSIQQIEALIVSELMLIALDVPTKFSDLNPGRDEKKHQALVKAASAFSMDLTLTDIKIIKDRDGRIKSGLKIPNDAYTVSDIRLDTKINAKQKETLDYYYNILLQHDKNVSQNGVSQGIGEGNQNQYNSAAPNMPGNRNGNNDVHNWEDRNNRDETHNKIKRLVSSTYNSLSDHERGIIAGFMADHIKLIMTPPQIPWQKELKSQIGTIRFGSRSSFKRPNRRQSDRLDLPGKIKNRIVRIVVGLDTSGSMSEDEISMVLNEVLAICKTVPTEITLIECDSKISKEPYIIRKPNDIQTKVSGRGGTEFTPVVEYINEHNFKDALFIYFTDGYGEDSIPKPKVYRTIWILTDKRNRLSVENPYGKILYLDSDPKFKRG